MHPFERKSDKPSKRYVTLPPLPSSLSPYMMRLCQVGNLSEPLERKHVNLLSDHHCHSLTHSCPKSDAETDLVLDRDINNLIMDYLITEGYPSAARKFAAEANIQPKVDFESINERVEIRDSIHRGDLQTAIEKINELNPQVCRASSHFLTFSVQLAMIIMVFHAPLICLSGR
jgi:LisH